jgi:hypothetical protein
MAKRLFMNIDIMEILENNSAKYQKARFIIAAAGIPARFYPI